MAISIKSSVKLKLLDSNVKEIRDSFGTTNLSSSTTGKGIFARIAATHAGMINRNNFFYLPDRMRKSIDTFVTPFKKPILINHNEESDPIGRVVSARYVDTSGLLQDSLTSNLKAFDSKFTPLVKGHLSLEDEVKFVCDNLSNFLNTDDNYEGLGFAEIIANITDSSAIEKFLDGRYLTGSVAAATEHAFCSICQEDWAESPCDHRPGKIYDNKKAFLIAGDFTYEHWAIVNTPADVNSKTLEISNGLTDSVKVEDIDFSGKLSEVTVSLLDSYKEEEMEDKLPETDTQIISDQTTDIQNTEKVIEPTVVIESDDDFITRIMDSKEVNDTEEEKFYSLLIEAMKEEGLDEKTIEDAKLSSEKRKGLAKSTFCGPERSFPVPDCAHVVAARRLISRYKGTGNKEKILACVSRKAKAMGCDKMKDVKAPDPIVETKDNSNHIGALQELLNIVANNNWIPEDKKPLDEKDLKVLQTLIEKLASMVTMDTLVTTSLSIKDFRLLTDKQLLDEIVKLEETLGQVRDEFEKEKNDYIAAKSEMELSIKEANTLRDNIIQLKTELRDSKVQYMALLKSLQKKQVVDVATFSELTDSALVTDLEFLTKNVDIQLITDKLSDGMSRIPEGTIENPVLTVDNKQVKHSKDDVKKELQMIQDKYTSLLFTNSFAAQQYKAREIARMRLEGKIP